jgi:hypothetical protein
MRKRNRRGNLPFGSPSYIDGMSWKSKRWVALKGVFVGLNFPCVESNENRTLCGAR